MLIKDNFEECIVTNEQADCDEFRIQLNDLKDLIEDTNHAFEDDSLIYELKGKVSVTISQ